MATAFSLVTGEGVTEAAQLDGRVRRAATVLVEHGVGANDCVALLLRNDAAFVEATLACRWLGAYCVPINWHSAADEVDYVLNDCGATLLIGHADLLARLGRPVIAVIAVTTPQSIRAAYRLENVALGAYPDWEALLIAATPFQQRVMPALRDSIMYTSGTSGRPKGVRRRPPTPDQAAANERMRKCIFGIGVGDRALLPAPMYHAAPNQFMQRAVAYADLLVLPPRFDAEALLAQIEQYAITHVYAVPAMFTRLLALPAETRARYDLSSLCNILHAGGPCSSVLKTAMIEWLGPIISEYYGSTEAGPLTFVEASDWLRRPGTVGRPVEGVELRIIDEAGDEVAPGQVGEIVASNLNYPDFTYINRDDERAELDRGRLLASGDLGYLDDGWLFLCDRKRDLVISGGVNIYPAEVEAALLQIDGVMDCAVFGIPDDEYSEAVMAVIQLETGAALSEQDVQAALRERIAAYKVPRRIEIRDNLPREESGKLRKRVLRDPYWASVERNI